MGVEKPNRVLLHTRALVESLADGGPLNAAEAARKLDIPRPSAHRLLAALAHEGLAKQDDEGLVSLSNAWLRLGDSALRAGASWFHHDEVLEQIRDRTGLTVFLCVPRPNRTVCIRRLHGRSYQILALRPGGSLPLHLGGVGRVTLAFGEDRDHYLTKEPFEAVTPFSLTTVEQLENDIEVTCREGAALSDQDVTLGVAALAVPVFDADERFQAALSVAGRREDVVGHENDLREVLQQGVTAIGHGRA